MLCFDLMEMVGKEVELVRHKATFKPVLDQIERGGTSWMFEEEHNYNIDGFDKQLIKAQEWFLAAPAKWFKSKAGTFDWKRIENINIQHNTFVLPWWYLEIFTAFQQRIDNSPVFYEYLY
jgi:hypothetical protein